MPNKYGLDFRVWEKQPNAKQKPPTGGGPIGAYGGAGKTAHASKDKTDNVAVCEEDIAAKPREEEPYPYAKVALKKIAFAEGPAGFAFNKACQAVCQVELKHESASKKAAIELFCRYGGNDELIERYEIVLDKAGERSTGIKLFYGEQYYKALRNSRDETCEYVLKLSHPDTGSTLESDPLFMPAGGCADGGMIFFAPGRGANSEGEYFEIEESDLDALVAHVEEIDALATEISELRRLFESGDESALQKSEQLEEKVKKQLKGLTANPANAIQELLAVTDNVKWGKLKKRVYIDPYATKRGQVKGHWRKTSDTKIRDKIQRWFQKTPDDQKSSLQKQLKGVLWKSDQIDTQWPLKWRFSGQADADTAAGYFKATGEVQFCRFVAGVQADAAFDLDKMELQLAAHGELSYSLAEGTVTGQWSLPAKNGIDLFTLFLLNDKGKNAVKDRRQCLMRLTLEARGKAFAGAALSGAVALPAIDLSAQDENAGWCERKRKADQRMGRAEAGGEVFAGATAQGQIGAIGEWSPGSAVQFDSLAAIQAVAAGSLGVGAGAKVKFGYENGKLRFECGATVVAGLGGKAGYMFEVGIDEGFELLAHIMHSVYYHRVSEIAEEAFAAFRDYSFATFCEAGELVGYAAARAVDEVRDFAVWLSGKYSEPEKLKMIKAEIRARLNDSRKLEKSPPETLGGQILRTIMATEEEEDFDAIIKVLESAETDHELKWIIRRIVDLHGKDPNGELLQKGIRQLAGYGIGMSGYNAYEERVKEILHGSQIAIR
jgi:hypothetical protein